MYVHTLCQKPCMIESRKKACSYDVMEGDVVGSPRHSAQTHNSQLSELSSALKQAQPRRVSSRKVSRASASQAESDASPVLLQVLAQPSELNPTTIDRFIFTPQATAEIPELPPSHTNTHNHTIIVQEARARCSHGPDQRDQGQQPRQPHRRPHAHQGPRPQVGWHV